MLDLGEARSESQNIVFRKRMQGFELSRSGVVKFHPVEGIVQEEGLLKQRVLRRDVAQAEFQAVEVNTQLRKVTLHMFRGGGAIAILAVGKSRGICEAGGTAVYIHARTVFLVRESPAPQLP